MSKHLLIPTDGSELSESAVRQGIAFAKSIDAKVALVLGSETTKGLTHTMIPALVCR